VIHFAVLSSPRYCDHLGWCAASTATANTALPRRWRGSVGGGFAPVQLTRYARHRL